ncbi:MAG: RNA 3'-terminal phosphate cyclase [Tepidisphaera sp.]|nr:RNA 3'-terminal phosphate cyclase [Tepidisphaera sp.]
MGHESTRFEPTAEQAESLIHWLGSPDVTLRDIAEMHDVSLEALTQWMGRPEIGARLDAVESAVTRRTRFIATGFLPAAVKMLHAVLINHESRELSSGAMNAAARERANEAAELLWKLTRAAAAHEAGEETRGQSGAREGVRWRVPEVPLLRKRVESVVSARGAVEPRMLARLPSGGAEGEEKIEKDTGGTPVPQDGVGGGTALAGEALAREPGRPSLALRARQEIAVTGEKMIYIDGSQGEGGGQILRSALSLSMLTGTPFRIEKIRAGRAKPGLMRQHLACVIAAREICGGGVEGAEVGSQALTFFPGQVRPGSYCFPIGSAGGTTLVMQAILPALLAAAGPSTVVVEGGTHNDMAPPFEFFERCLTPLINRAGANVTARLERHGFYPAGGGRIVVEVSPAAEPREVVLLERGEAAARRVKAIVSKLPRHVGEREVSRVCEKLGMPREAGRVDDATGALGHGNALIIELVFGEVTEVVSSLGEVRKSAEAVADEAIAQAKMYLAHGAPVGEHLADQLMLPLAAMAGGRYATTALTPHSTTNMEVIRAFGGEVSHEAGVVSVRALRRSRAKED